MTEFLTALVMTSKDSEITLSTVEPTDQNFADSDILPHLQNCRKLKMGLVELIGYSGITKVVDCMRGMPLEHLDIDFAPIGTY